MIKRFKKAFSILNSKEKNLLILLFFLTIINLCLEVLSLSMIIPLINLITNANSDNYFFLIFKDYFEIDSIKSGKLILYAVSVFSLIFLFKSLFVQFFYWFKGRFIYDLISNLSSKIFDIYLNQNINFFHQKNSSELIRNVTSETERFSIGFINHSLEFLIDLMIIVGICIVLFAYEPAGFLSIFIFLGSTSSLLFILSRKYVFHLGKKRQEAESKRLKNLNHGFMLFKEIKLLFIQKFFVDLYTKQVKKFTSVAFKEMLIGRSPRIWIEFLAVVGLSIFLVVLTFNNKSTIEIISISSLYAVATFRLIPSFNKVITSFMQIRYNSPVCDVVYEQINLGKEEKKKYLEIKNHIEFKNLIFRYKNSEDPILENINLKINKSDCVGIIGKTGSGKSTLADIVMGFKYPEKGKIYVDGQELNSNESVLKNFCYVSQNLDILDDTILNNITLGNYDDSDKDKKRLSESLILSESNDFVNQLPEKIYSVIGERGSKVSGGQKQRLIIARAIYHNRNFLVFDEATSALDYETESKLFNSIEKMIKKGITIIIISHREQNLKLCNQIFRIKDRNLIKVNE